MGVMLDGEPLTPDVAAGVLASLRWDVDQQIINHEGDHVWLGPSVFLGHRSGVTDCCFVADPCEHHAAVAKGDARSTAAELLPRLMRCRACLYAMHFHVGSTCPTREAIGTYFDAVGHFTDRGLSLLTSRPWSVITRGEDRHGT